MSPKATDEGNACRYIPLAGNSGRFTLVRPRAGPGHRPPQGPALIVSNSRCRHSRCRCARRCISSALARPKARMAFPSAAMTGTTVRSGQRTALGGQGHDLSAVGSFSRAKRQQALFDHGRHGGVQRLLGDAPVRSRCGFLGQRLAHDSHQRIRRPERCVRTGRTAAPPRGTGRCTRSNWRFVLSSRARAWDFFSSILFPL